MLKYILVTPAHNEAEYIEGTILSVVNQLALPEKWVIVSDNSSDDTDQIVKNYARKYHFIELLTIRHDFQRSFSSKVNAFNAGLNVIGNIGYDLIGNLDADLTFEKEYFHKIINEFDTDSKLGITGGIISEKINEKYVCRTTDPNSVAGAVQLFRRDCFLQIGGYEPLPYGGIDSLVEIKARMKGWKVRTCSDIIVFHHRRIGGQNNNIFKTGFKKGLINYSLGYSPFFSIIISCCG
ncbi:MAG: glycosyltransferase family 2 protein [Paludibacter sp.]